MDFDAGAVQAHCLDLDAHDLVSLEPLEHAVEHPLLGPAAHARVDRVPVAEAFRQAAPIAAVLDDVEDGVDHLEVGDLDVSALLGEERGDALELLSCDFHDIEKSLYSRNTPLQQRISHYRPLV